MADSFTFHGRTLRVGDRIGTRTITAVPDHKPWYRHWVGGYVETRCDCGRKRAASAGVLLGLRKRPGRLHVCRPAAPTIDDVTKDRARAAVSSAVASGLLVRPRHCSLCGKEAPVVGHHRDYAHPLAVVWCCHSCHAKEHAKTRRTNARPTVVRVTRLVPIDPTAPPTACCICGDPAVSRLETVCLTYPAGSAAPQQQTAASTRAA